MKVRVMRMKDVCKDFAYQWPTSAGTEIFEFVVEYVAAAEDGQHDVKVGFCRRPAYGRNRPRVVIWIDDYPHAEFLGSDDFEKSGEVLSEIKVPGNRGERICRYPSEPIPERYAMFNVEGLPIRVKGPRVHKAWGVVANIADHKSLIALAALRRLERMRRT